MLACLFNVFLLLNPQETVVAAREGLLLWFNQVLPSLLPFMIGINILIGTGFAQLLGALLSGITAPLFHVPGAGGFALITGLTSGYPMGAKVIAQLRTENQITQTEAQRLIGFCNNAGPLFIVGVAGTGLFGSASAGYCLWASHVSAALVMGFLLRFYKRKEHTHKPDSRHKKTALDVFFSYRQTHDCAMGSVLGESVKNATEAVVIIGGYIIFFSVLTRGLSYMIMGPDLFKGIFSGILEVTNGVKLLVSDTDTPVMTRLACASGVIAFGGFSIHAQTIHFIRHTDINVGLYILTKMAHAMIAVFICIFIFPFFKIDGVSAIVPVMRLNPQIPTGWWTLFTLLCVLVTMVYTAAEKRRRA